MHVQGGKALVEFSFISRAAGHLPLAARLRIARQAWLHNIHRGLTGELEFDDGCFRAVIEGSCDEILPLAAQILTDPRHCDVAVRALRAIAVRRYPTWSAIGFGLPAQAADPVANLHALPLFAARDAAVAALPAQGGLIG